ncbi:unnamed protein product [Adineta steineri]|uniref:NHL repeat containing protein n=1 Tax=Adineta steineri TaxID=433720 RepID=A0A815R275_9BILA|nr:unnamed protein product [Adineta steineri]CAF3559692.1 unnamed protein product [Adineta steineri]
MAMANNKTQCFTCNKEKITYSCEGCSQRFCFTDLAEHKQLLNDALNHIINDYDEFKQTINEQKQNPQNHPLIKQIDQWEIKSIEIVQQKAKECRETVVKYSQIFMNDIEHKFNHLSEQIKQIHKENEFNEINLNYLTNELIQIKEELNGPSKISLEQSTKLFINAMSVVSSKKRKFNKWEQNAITVAGGNGEGQQLNQLNRPTGIFIDKKKNVFIADCSNHRIIEWKYNAKEGQIIAGGNGNGNRMNQLNGPTDMIVNQQNDAIIVADFMNERVIQWLNQKQQILIQNIDCLGLAMDKYGFLYVSDYKKNEVRRWKMGEYDNEGIVVAGGNGQGDQLNQLNSPCFIFVDEEQSVYVSDCNNHRVMKWRIDATEGIVVAGGNGEGGNPNQLSSPEAVSINGLGQIYVANYGNHRVMRWCEGNAEGEIVVGRNDQGDQGNQLNGPSGLCFDDEGNLYVADHYNDRIQKFEIICE